MRNSLEIFEGGHIAANQPFQILALSGGGFRGLFTAQILEKLETRAGRRLREVFDLIAGTSIGGIIACGLACGIPATAIRQAIESDGPKIFVRQNRVLGRLPGGWLFANRYSPDGLRKTVKKVLGEFAQAEISTIRCPLLVVAISRTDATSILFESAGAAPPEIGRTKLLDVAMATSAAPTYFPEHQTGAMNMIDGGLVANSPDAIALMRGLGRFGRLPVQIRMISVGTAGEKFGDVSRAARGYGAINWLQARRLFDVTTSAQEELSIQLAREVLGDNYVRIDVIPSATQQEAIGLDVTSQTATGTLLQLADQALRLRPPSDGLIGTVLRQRATWYDMLGS